MILEPENLPGCILRSIDQVGFLAKIVSPRYVTAAIIMAIFVIRILKNPCTYFKQNLKNLEWIDCWNLSTGCYKALPGIKFEHSYELWKNSPLLNLESVLWGMQTKKVQSLRTETLLSTFQVNLDLKFAQKEAAQNRKCWKG